MALDIYLQLLQINAHIIVNLGWQPIEKLGQVEAVEYLIINHGCEQRHVGLWVERARHYGLFPIDFPNLDDRRLHVPGHHVAIIEPESVNAADKALEGFCVNKVPAFIQALYQVENVIVIFEPAWDFVLHSKILTFDVKVFFIQFDFLQLFPI